MGAVEPIEFLRQVPLFSRLSNTNLQRVAEIARQEVYPRRSLLFAAGQPGRALYCLVSGEAVVRAVVARRRLRPVTYLQAGDCVGVTSLLLGEPHDATVQATTDVVALVIHKSDFDRLRRDLADLDDELALPDEVTSKLRREGLPWLQPREVVVFFGRRHWFVFARSLLLPTLGVLAIGGLSLALLGALHVAAWYVPLILLLAIYLAIVGWNLVDWRNDYFVVTTQRVVRRDYVLYTYESRHEAPLNRIQDVLIKRGYWANLLGYGNLTIETAAQSGIGRILFDYLPDPDSVKAIIFQQINRTEAQSLGQAREVMSRELKRRLGWVTPDELATQGQRQAAHSEGPPSPGPKRRARLPRFRILPALRLEEDGRITWRKHWLFLLRRLIRPMLVAFLWFLLAIGWATESIPFLSPRTLGWGLGLLVAGLGIAFWLWWQAVDWENDVYILTDDRIIDVEKRPLFFSEERREATLDRIQNVRLTIPGPTAALLHYGNVEIDTAGGEGEFTFFDVVEPHEVQREIMSRVARFRERQEQIANQQRRREMADWFAVYEELRRGQRRGPAPTPPRAVPPEGTKT